MSGVWPSCSVLVHTASHPQWARLASFHVTRQCFKRAEVDAASLLTPNLRSVPGAASYWSESVQMDGVGNAVPPPWWEEQQSHTVKGVHTWTGRIHGRILQPVSASVVQLFWVRDDGGLDLGVMWQQKWKSRTQVFKKAQFSCLGTKACMGPMTSQWYLVVEAWHLPMLSDHGLCLCNEMTRPFPTKTYGQ